MSFRESKRAAAQDGNRAAFLKKGEADFLYLEQFKALRAKFEYKADLHGCRVVAVTSAIAGEGKTVSIINLAKSLASSGRRKVLLIDMDLRKSDLGKSLEIPAVPGLTEFFAGSAGPKEIIRNSIVPGLHVVTTGTRIWSPADLIAGEKFRSYLKHLRSHFEIILLDTPPIIPVADALNLRDQVDGFLVVYRVGFTPYPMLKQVVEELGEKQILGVVLNGVEPRGDRYYQRYYGKYYRKPNPGESPA